MKTKTKFKKTKSRYTQTGQTPENLESLLLIAFDESPDLKKIKKLSQEELDDTYEWAAREMWHASDNLYIRRWPKPDWLEQEK